MNGSLVAIVLCATVYFVLRLHRTAYHVLGPVGRARLQPQLPEGVRTASEEPSAQELRLPTAVQLAMNGALVAAVALLTSVLGGASTWGSRALAIGVGFGLFVVALEHLARVLARARPDSTLLGTLPFALLVDRLMWPLAAPLASLQSGLGGRMPRESSPQDEDSDEQGMRAFIDVGEREGILEAEEGKLVESVLEFGETRVDEVMTPRTEMVALPATATLAEVLPVISRERRTRYPVFHGDLDHIEGVLCVKDLFEDFRAGATGRIHVGERMRSAFLVPETKLVDALLREFQHRRERMAVVVDEHGGTAGIVTTEDLVEEIVGDLLDEHEGASEAIVRESSGTYLATGRAELDELAELVGVDFDASEAETVGGLISAELGRVPTAGEVVVFQGTKFEVLDADRRRVRRVRLTTDTVPSEEAS